MRKQLAPIATGLLALVFRETFAEMREKLTKP